MLLDALSIPAAASTCGQQGVHIPSTQRQLQDERIAEDRTDELRWAVRERDFRVRNHVRRDQESPGKSRVAHLEL